MSQDSENDMEDLGRRESENQLRNKPKREFLQDVVERAEQDHDEAIEMIERERKLIDMADRGFMNSLDMAMHRQQLERSISNDSEDGAIHSHSNSADRVKEVNALLKASEQLLKVNRKASQAISEASNESNQTMYRETLDYDRERVKDILTAGKRMVERDIDRLEARDVADADSAKQFPVKGAKGETVAQANHYFAGHRKGLDENEGAGKSLKYMEKGVRTMAKGAGPDA